MSSPKIILSFNEIMFYFTRAAVGVGLPYGLAEEFARSSIWLGISGLDPAKIALPALQSLDDKNSSLRAHQTEDINETFLFTTEEKQLSAFLSGPAVCDFISLQTEKWNKSHVLIAQNVDHPFLVAAAVGSYNLGCWEISWKDYTGKLSKVLIGLNGIWKTTWVSTEIPEHQVPSDVSIISIDEDFINSDIWRKQRAYSVQNRNQVLQEGVPIYGDWSKIYSYYSRILVPSTEKSLISGAGAGLVDKD